MQEPREILVVDDDSAIVELIEEVLQEEGYTVRVAHDIPDAITSVISQPPDLVLLDLMLPGNGQTLPEQLRLRGVTDVPIVIMSANRRVDAPLHNIAVADYLAKPFQLDELLTCVARNIRA